MYLLAYILLDRKKNPYISLKNVNESSLGKKKTKLPNDVAKTVSSEMSAVWKQGRWTTVQKSHS